MPVVKQENLQPLSEKQMPVVKQDTDSQSLSEEQIPVVKQEFNSDSKSLSVKQIPEVKSDTNPQPLSKSALKKIAKRQSWLDTKAERKAIQKQKRKEKVELNRKLGVYEMSYSGSNFILTWITIATG